MGHAYFYTCMGLTGTGPTLQTAGFLALSLVILGAAIAYLHCPRDSARDSLDTAW